MASVLLTKRIEFAASHRYHKPEWDAAKNRATFGACNNDPGHGHNYMLEVTVAGEVDQRTGMVVNLFDLKRVLLQVLEEFDHKHLNLDLPYFVRQIPTSENIARVLWDKLHVQKDIGTLQRICLYEDEDLCADLTAEAGLDVASVTRRYSFTAIHDGHRGHTWDLFVTVHGRIDPETGMVTDIVALDRLIKDRVLVPFDGHDLRIVLATPAVTGEYIARAVWDRIAPALPIGSLQLIKLVQTRDLSFEYAG
ncbi:MAG: putative 6-pyruvoyl-tetrahydropterin synthase (modular protein) [Nitrospira sp.]|jgi:6-pyruvoyltetrahydropterin/6-carboxytetrahydropterin synthase|nr:putative 6-pyruvoyl-tetrahydropterin synthase (modular protein) [Nitrospira sp.]